MHLWSRIIRRAIQRPKNNRLKTCSKCKRELLLERFVKSDRYSDGLYPLCKDCRKAIRLAGLKKYPMCSKCGKYPHTSNHRHCFACQREGRWQRPLVKFRRDHFNKTLCSDCKSAPRLEYHNYCSGCMNKAVRAWRKRQNPPRPFSEERRKASARHYINTLFKRGKIKRKPCEVCGKPSDHFHHLDYKDRTTNVQHLCHQHHVEAERAKRKALTVSIV